MPDMFYISLTTAFIFFVVPFVLGPIAVYFLTKSPVPEFFSLTDNEIESLTAPDFNRRSAAVAQLGFERAANFQWIMPTSTVYSRVFYNPQTQELAHVTDITAHNKNLPAAKVRVNYTEFVTSFEGAPQINTNNSSQGEVYRPDPDKQMHKLPGIYDAQTIYRAHRYLTSNVSAPVKSLPAPYLIREELEIETLNTLKRQEEFGLLYFHNETSTFRPTVFGATLMTWKLVFPVGMIRKFAMQRNARNLLAKSRASAS